MHAKKVSDTLGQRAGQVNQLIVDGNLLFAALDERRQALSNLIAGIDDVSQQLSGFVADNRREFRPALEKLNLVLDNLLERRDHIGEALKRLPPYATALGEVVGSGPGFQINLYGLPPAPIAEVLFDTYFQPGKLPDSLSDILQGLHLRAPHHQAEVAMTHPNPSSGRSRWLRIALAAVLVAVLVAGVYLVVAVAHRPQGGRRTSRRRSACIPATMSASSGCRWARSTRSSRAPATSRSP